MTKSIFCRRANQAATDTLSLTLSLHEEHRDMVTIPQVPHTDEPPLSRRLATNWSKTRHANREASSISESPSIRYWTKSLTSRSAFAFSWPWTVVLARKNRTFVKEFRFSVVCTLE